MMARRSYSVEVCYPDDLYPDKDRIMEEIVGIMSHGSGMGFGERDMSWSYKTLPAAKRCFDKLVKRTRFNVTLRTD